MKSRHMISCVLTVPLLLWAAGCNLTLSAPDLSLPAQDGIDPDSPNVERSTEPVDFTGVRTIRIDLPNARVSVTQSEGTDQGSIRVTEIIVRQGLSHDDLNTFLTASGIVAERSFVDESRLDVEATVAEGLADADIVFDIRLVVPVGANIEILVDNGPVEVKGLTGNTEIRTHDGAIDVEGVTGNVVALTTGRPVSVVDVTGNVQADTTEADITLQLSPPAGAQISAKTTAGTVRLMLDRATAASLDLTAQDGAVTADLAGFSITDVSTGSGFLKGILNGGGGQVEAKTIGGEIDFLGI
ncbi:MAG: DUF4097 family beta strand repeat-containing protein [Phycisphaerae bacterium]